MTLTLKSSLLKLILETYYAQHHEGMWEVLPTDAARGTSQSLTSSSRAPGPALLICLLSASITKQKTSQHQSFPCP